MSTFVNNNTQLITANTGILGTSSGLVVYTNNSGSAQLARSMRINYTTTATAGTRNVTFNTKTGPLASSTNLFQSLGFSASSPSSTVSIYFAPGLTNTTSFINLPQYTYIMPGTSVVIQDTANIDVNDTIGLCLIVVET